MTRVQYFKHFRSDCCWNQNLLTFHYDNKRWQPAIVTKKHDQISYIVRTPNGAIYRRNRRNRRHLLKLNENSQNMYFQLPSANSLTLTI